MTSDRRYAIRDMRYALRFLHRHARLRQRLPAADRIRDGDVQIAVARPFAIRGLQTHRSMPEALRHPYAVLADAFGDFGLNRHGAGVAGDFHRAAVEDAALGSRLGVNPQFVFRVHLVEPQVVLSGELRVLADLAGEQVELAGFRLGRSLPRRDGRLPGVAQCFRSELDLAARRVEFELLQFVRQLFFLERDRQRHETRRSLGGADRFKRRAPAAALGERADVDAQGGQLTVDVVDLVLVLEVVAQPQPLAELLVDPQRAPALADRLDHGPAQEHAILDDVQRIVALQVRRLGQDHVGVPLGIVRDDADE